MSGISRETLFGKLNPIAYQSIESATVFCKMRGNPYVELVHWIAQLVQTQGTDVEAILRHYQIETSTLARDITTALDRLPRGSTSISDFSEHIEGCIKNGWLYGTLLFGQAQVRSGFLIVGLLQTQNLRNALVGISRQFERIKVEELADNFDKICGASKEATLGTQDGSSLGSGLGGEPGDPRGGRVDALGEGVPGEVLLPGRPGADDDLGVRHDALGQEAPDGVHDLGEVPGQGFRAARVEGDVVAVADDEAAEAVPLGLVQQIAARGRPRDAGHRLAQHRVHGQRDRDAREGLCHGHTLAAPERSFGEDFPADCRREVFTRSRISPSRGRTW